MARKVLLLARSVSTGMLFPHQMPGRPRCTFPLKAFCGCNPAKASHQHFGRRCKSQQTVSVQPLRRRKLSAPRWRFTTALIEKAFRYEIEVKMQV